MSGTIKRIDLPSGGWWEIETRPRWKHVRECEDCTEQTLLTHALAALTTAWSFTDEISPESVASRAENDLASILEALNDGLTTFLNEESPMEMAEGLFAGFVAGQIPRQFVEVHIMAAAGWNWQTLQETPADIVRKMTVYLSVSRARDCGGALDFNQEQEQQNAKQ